MTAEVVNLRRARKAKARGDAAKTAASKRVTFGRSGAEKQLLAARSAMAERRLDDHRLSDHTIDLKTREGAVERDGS